MGSGSAGVAALHACTPAYAWQGAGFETVECGDRGVQGNVSEEGAMEVGV
jgi:hypothetical protein